MYTYETERILSKHDTIKHINPDELNSFGSYVARKISTELCILGVTGIEMLMWFTYYSVQTV